MADRKAVGFKLAILTLAAASMIGLAAPAIAHAGGVHLSIGIGIPTPVYVAPAPVVVAPAPVIVHPPPAVVYQSPVVVTEPYFVYQRPLPPGLAKKYHGYYPAHGYKFYKPGKPRW
jgi:PXPV repeat (3 copies)